MKVLTFSSLTFALAVLVPLSAQAAGEPEGLEKWQSNHPEASRELGDWVKNHPDAAGVMFEWDGKHPGKAEAMVKWAIAHPGEGVEKYVADHKGEPYLDKIMEKHQLAANEFLNWARTHKEGAEALMHHSRGLEWAGHHLYKEHWHLEHPNAEGRHEAREAREKHKK